MTDSDVKLTLVSSQKRATALKLRGQFFKGGALTETSKYRSLTLTSQKHDQGSAGGPFGFSVRIPNTIKSGWKKVRSFGPGPI